MCNCWLVIKNEKTKIIWKRLAAGFCVAHPWGLCVGVKHQRWKSQLMPLASAFVPLLFYFHHYWIGWVNPVDTHIPLLFCRMLPSVFVGVRMRASYENQVQLSPQDSLPPLASSACQGMSEEALARGALMACNCKNPKAKQWKSGWINVESVWK